MRFLPRFVYETLPYLYLLVGILAIVKIPGKLGVASGLLLVAIGILVFKLRLTYRAEVREGARIMMGADPCDFS
ncbi:MAG TPA: hypothetical protein VFF03_16120 [Rhodocyclaceae bacterium]|nr:hypothetical protein [Rhodocyclaceae bacterium]